MAEPLSDDVIGFVSKSGYVFKGRISTNDFALGRQDMKISTFFKPEKGIERYIISEFDKYETL